VAEASALAVRDTAQAQAYTFASYAFANPAEARDLVPAAVYAGDRRYAFRLDHFGWSVPPFVSEAETAVPMRGSRRYIYGPCGDAEGWIDRLAWRIVRRDRYTIVSSGTAKCYLDFVRIRLCRHLGKLDSRIPWQTVARLHRYAYRWCGGTPPFGVSDADVIATRSCRGFEADILVDGEKRTLAIQRGWKHLDAAGVVSKMLRLLKRTEFDVTNDIDAFNRADRAKWRAVAKKTNVDEGQARAREIVADIRKTHGVATPRNAEHWDVTTLRVFAKGIKAQREGKKLGACPYGTRTATRSVVLSRRYADAWRKGWRCSAKSSQH